MRSTIPTLILALVTASCGGADCPSGYIDVGGICVDLATDSGNCGGYGIVCGPGHVCEMGVCVLSCPEGMTECAGVCRDLASDDYNCGMCDLTCAAGYRCTDGSCAPECPAGYTACSGYCKNLQNDPSNCGECANACPAGEVCMAGTCTFTCPSPYIDCSGSCVDLLTDHMNCGACGDACLSGQVCEDGACQNSCLAGLTLCSGACADLQRDPQNCGSCATRCASDEVCVGGACVLACPPGFDDCSGSCRDLTSDRLNCGTCDNACGVAEVCDSGTCSFMCLSPLTDCSGLCTNLDDDPDNCGTCGHACDETHATAYCSSGSCGLICDTNYDDCDVDVTTGCEAPLMYDRTNCGTCGTACATDEICLSGSCAEFTGIVGTARMVDGTWIPVIYVPCGSGAPGTCNATTAKTSCTGIGARVVSHASDGTTEVLSLGATVSCYWDVSYYVVDVVMPSDSCLVGISNLEWSSCCGTSSWHGNTLAFGTPGSIYGYVRSGDSGYVSTYPNVDGTHWGCVSEATAATNRSGCTQQYVACTP